MPDPIKVDFRRRRRPAKAASAPARKPYPGQTAQKAVNWRALPRFLLFMLALALLFAGVNWIARALV
jgi:hypothetical protein